MSSQSNERQPGQDPPTAAAGPGPKTLATTDSQLLTERGTTSIADGVVQKIAGIATREVPGIHNMGTGRVRTFGAVRELIPGTGGPNISQGVSVDVGRTQATVDLDIVPEYGVPVDDLTVAIRRNVISMLERMTALQVVAVNIAVDDIHMPDDDDDDQPPPRVVAQHTGAGSPGSERPGRRDPARQRAAPVTSTVLRTQPAA